MAARIVLTCWGSYGDLFPYLRLALELKSRGHVPVLATCPYYRELVEPYGIAFHPIPPDVDPADEALLARVMDPARGTEVIIRDLLVPPIRQAFDALSDAVKGADLLITHPVTFAGPLVGEARKLPWISTVLAPTSFFSLTDFPLLPPFPGVVRLMRRWRVTTRAFKALGRRITAPWTGPVRDFRRELGLEDHGDPLYEGQFSAYGTLGLFSSILGGPQPDWPPRTEVTGFVFGHHDGELPPEVESFLDAGDPPIVFTLGSSAVGAAGSFYAAAARATVTLGRRAILLVGRDPRNRSAQLPESVLAAEYAPHARLFPRAAAVVHHGGIGTTAEALRSGRPMLVVPHAHDQPDNADRVARLGVARVLDARAFRAETASAELDPLLRDPAYARRADEVGRRIRSENGVGAACDAILRYLP